MVLKELLTKWLLLNLDAINVTVWKKYTVQYMTFIYTLERVF